MRRVGPFGSRRSCQKRKRVLDKVKSRTYNNVRLTPRQSPRSDATRRHLHLPVCASELAVTRLHCRSCGTTLEGDFSVGRFGRLNRDQLALLESFLRSRGNLREMERELGISYPTVRSRVEALVRALGFGPRDEEATTTDEATAPPASRRPARRSSRPWPATRSVPTRPPRRSVRSGGSADDRRPGCTLGSSIPSASGRDVMRWRLADLRIVAADRDWSSVRSMRMGSPYRSAGNRRGTALMASRSAQHDAPGLRSGAAGSRRAPDRGPASARGHDRVCERGRHRDGGLRGDQRLRTASSDISPRRGQRARSRSPKGFGRQRRRGSRDAPISAPRGCRATSRSNAGARSAAPG